MRKEACANCAFYKKQEDKSGREWMNADGYCTVVRLNPRAMKVAESNWCDRYVEMEVNDMPKPTMFDLMEAAGVIEAIPEAELAGAPTPPYARLYDAIATVHAALDELEEALDQIEGCSK
jgi:High potential iron-sulfur protein